VRVVTGQFPGQVESGNPGCSPCVFRGIYSRPRKHLTCTNRRL
jgi:hypothetical protein